MPELPEVETVRRRVETRARGLCVVDTWARPDPLVFIGTSARGVRRAVAGKRVVGTDRRGKHFWIRFDDGPALLFHLGMTGDVVTDAAGDPRPRFTRLALELEDGGRLTFTDPRRLGRVRLAADPLDEDPVRGLGVDPYLAMPSLDELARLVGARRAPIKAVLLDQTVLAGIGNWIADEVLYQARVAPHRPACSLARAELAALRRAIARVITHAVDVGADDARFPRGWLFHVRWGKRRGAVSATGAPLAFSTVGGRTTAWVPSVQR